MKSPEKKKTLNLKISADED